MTVEQWTGRESRLLRQALRQSVRGFADYLGVPARTVSKWEQDGGLRTPRPEFQAMLDTVLARASDEQRDRFTASLGTVHSGTAGGDDPTNRRQFLSGLALAPAFAEIRPRPAASLDVGQVDDLLAHLGDQWHLLVKTDNLFGPRYALPGVLDQIQLIEDLLLSVRDGARTEFVRIGAQYAESAAWLYEDSGDLPSARAWNSRAMEWAHESGDTRMLAWTLFRRSQQAMPSGIGAEVIGLARAARRNEEQLANPTRAAIRVQEALGLALDGHEQTSQRLFDEAHTWAANDSVGDARDGHGSYCIPSYIELQRASSWLTIGKPKKAIALYEDSLRLLPVAYPRNRAAALSRLAVAYLADGQLEQAATTASAALPVARSAGSTRIVDEIESVRVGLAPHRALEAVAALLDDPSNEGDGS